MKHRLNEEKHFEEEKKELLAKREKVKALTNQPKIIGDYCEELIRDFVSKRIDDKYSVKHGLIYDQKGQRSKECDAIIFEKGKFLVEYGDLVIVDQDFVKFVMQVKSTLNSDSLQKAILNLESVKRLNKHIMGWIVGFETKIHFKTLYRNASKSRSVQFLHAFDSKMERESKSLLSSQMKLFRNTISQCGDYSKYGWTDDLVIYKEGKGRPALILGKDQQKNDIILSEIYTKGLWNVMKNSNLTFGFEPPK